MGGREIDDDDTHERHTDTNKLTRHTASWLPHTLDPAEQQLDPGAARPGAYAAYNFRWRAQIMRARCRRRSADKTKKAKSGEFGGRLSEVARVRERVTWAGFDLRVYNGYGLQGVFVCVIRL